VTNIGRLPFVREEADALVDLVPENERSVWRRFDANREAAIREDLSRYRFIHFATHGLLNLRYPNLSCLMLSRFDKDRQRREGSLRLQDIYRMKLSADLVVLSACQTALGKEIRGEGLVSLTRGFMYAGSRSVIASLWNIEDEASAELMKRFYQKMLGPEEMSPAAALRAAQIEMMGEDRFRDPYLWGAFVLQGEWK
jgi:CHAT domain-containing protein